MEKNINEDLDQVVKWSKMNKMVISQTKTKCMLVVGERLRKRLDNINSNLNISLNGAVIEQGRVVRKPVNANPGLKINRGNSFSCINVLSIAYVLCSLRLLMFKTEGQKIETELLAEMLQKLNQNSR